MKKVICVDIGSSSARVITADGSGNFCETARFFHAAERTENGLRWNVEELFQKLKAAVAGLVTEGTADKIGVCSWGVDYGVVKADGTLSDAPFCYRDKRTECVYASRDKRADFAKSGIYPAPMNTVYQLLCDKETGRCNGAKICSVADLFVYYLTGNLFFEKTNASTTGLLSLDGNSWNWEFIDELGIDKTIFPQLVGQGESCGNFLGAEVFSVCAHDTGSAIFAMGDMDESTVFLSTGSWIIVGTLASSVNVSSEAFDRGYTNERGYGGAVTFLKNIDGLYILQKLMREQNLTLSFLDERIDNARNLGKLSLCSLGDRDVKQQFLEQLGLSAADNADLIRTYYDNLVDDVLHEVKVLDSLTGATHDKIKITGGLSKSAYAMKKLRKGFCGKIEIVNGEGSVLGIAKILLQGNRR